MLRGVLGYSKVTKVLYQARDLITSVDHNIYGIRHYFVLSTGRREIC